jgi:hypothetical protein
MRGGVGGGGPRASSGVDVAERHGRGGEGAHFFSRCGSKVLHWRTHCSGEEEEWNDRRDWAAHHQPLWALILGCAGLNPSAHETYGLCHCCQWFTAEASPVALAWACGLREADECPRKWPHYDIVMTSSFASVFVFQSAVLIIVSHSPEPGTRFTVSLKYLWQTNNFHSDQLFIKSYTYSTCTNGSHDFTR